MKGKIFFDTNFFVYLFSRSEPEKRNHCLALMDTLGKGSNTLVWSTQVVQEFYVTMTRKFQKDPQLVKSSIRLFHHMELVVNSMNTIEQAIDIQTTAQLSFWDSLVISAAQQAHCTILISEDLNDGQIIQGIEIRNPFSLKV